MWNPYYNHPHLSYMNPSCSSPPPPPASTVLTTSSSSPTTSSSPSYLNCSIGSAYNSNASGGAAGGEAAVAAVAVAAAAAAYSSLSSSTSSSLSSSCGGDDSSAFLNVYQSVGTSGAASSSKAPSEQRSSSVSSDIGTDLDSISATSTPNYQRYLSTMAAPGSLPNIHPNHQFYPNGNNNGLNGSNPFYASPYANSHPGLYDVNYLLPLPPGSQANSIALDPNYGYQIHNGYPIMEPQFAQFAPSSLPPPSVVKPQLDNINIPYPQHSDYLITHHQQQTRRDRFHRELQDTKLKIEPTGVADKHRPAVVQNQIKPSNPIARSSGMATNYVPNINTHLRSNMANDGATSGDGNRIVISCNDIDFKYPLKKWANPNIKARLQDAELWRRFREAGTEMIITKAGRRMFPILRISLSGLESQSKYIVFVDIVPYDDKRYKYQNQSWLEIGKAEPHIGDLAYLHPDSPMSGESWMKDIISFHKLKLTNNHSDESGFMILNSMHQYIPRFHVVEEGRSINTFVFEDTVFMAVTSYQNEQITRLKIENNPFAKGFRDVTNRRDHKMKRNEHEEEEQPIVNLIQTNKKRLMSSE